MQGVRRKALLMYLEPAPYILGLVAELSRRWPSGVEVLFAGEDISQEWRLALDPRYAAVLPRGFGRALRVVRSRLAARNYGIVHLAGWGHPLLLASMLVARSGRIPVVMESDSCAWTGTPLWKRAGKWLLYPLLFKIPSLLLPGGARQSAYLQGYGVPNHRMVKVHMTVDVAAISRHTDAVDTGRRAEIRRNFGLPCDALVFLYVGRMELHKGVQDLVEAFSQLPGRHDGAAALLLVGDGSNAGSASQAAAMDRHVVWAGRLCGAELLDAYAAADAFVLPSRFEPWGLVVNEAMAAGLPVIATDRVGCVDDLVHAGKTGLIVPAQSPHALSEAMASLMQNAVARDAMSRAARELIAGWTLEKEAEKIVEAWSRAG